MDTLVWESTICFNDKFQIQLEKKEEDTAIVNSILPRKNDNSLFLRYCIPVPRYKDLIKKEVYDLSFDFNTNKITPTSDNKNNFKIPNTVIPIQKTKSSQIYKDKIRRDLFFNKNKESSNELLKPESSVFLNKKSHNINVSSAASPLSTDSNKTEISFVFASSSTPIHENLSTNILNSKDNYFSLNKNVNSKFDSPDNIIEIMDMERSNDIQMEDVKEERMNIEAEESFNSIQKKCDNLIETENSNELIKKKSEENVVIEIKQSIKQELNVDKMDIEYSSLSSENSIKRISSSDKSLTPTIILNSSSNNTTSNPKPSIINDIEKSTTSENNEMDVGDEGDGDYESENEPLSIYVKKNKELKHVKREVNKGKTTITKRKENADTNENMKKRQKLNSTSTLYTDNNDEKLSKNKSLEKHDENKKTNPNLNEILEENKDIDKHIPNDEIINNKCSDEERDEKFLYDLCARINNKKKYWNDKYHYIKGTTVWALWKDRNGNFYYAGKIINYTKEYRVKYFDGDITVVSKDKLRPFNINVNDVVCVSLNNDVEFNEEDGINGLCIVQIKKKYNGNKNHDIKYEAMILKKKLDEAKNTYSLEKTDKMLTVTRRNFVLPENFLKIMEKQKLDIENKNLIETNIPNNNIKIEIPLKKSKIETNNIFESYSFIVTVGSDESENQMKKSSNTENQIYETVDKNEIQNQIKQLGGIIKNDICTSKFNYDNIPSNLLVIASIPSRTMKFLLGLALKLPIISYKWVKKCYKEEKFLSYNEYLISHGFSKELNSYMGSYYSSNELFNNLRFLIIGNSNFKSTYKLIISYSGGIIISDQKFRKNPNQCDYIICSKDFKKKDILKKSQLIKEYNNISYKKISISRSSSILTSNDVMDQTDGEEDLIETDITTENEDDLQSSFRNYSDGTSTSIPIFLKHEWIVQCLINQIIVDNTNYQINENLLY